MKIQCNVCDAAEANVLCCADEAALCWDCDQKVHAANKLASKHQRVPLSNSSSQMPLCDICKDTVGYCFCLEDRALLCRNCDVAIHNVNPLVSAHQRFLLTGVKVGAEGAESRPSSTPGNLNSPSNGKDFIQQACTAPRRTTPAFPEAHYQPGRPDGLSSSRLTFSGGSATGSASQWSLDEFLTLSDPNPNFYITDNGNGSSKCDSGKLGGDSDNSQRAADAETESDDCIGQVPDSHCTVPQIPSPPTASGLYWPKTHQIFGGSSMFVPDFGSSPLRDSPNHHHQPRFRSSKRRRNF